MYQYEDVILLTHYSLTEVSSVLSHYYCAVTQNRILVM